MCVCVCVWCTQCVESQSFKMLFTNTYSKQQNICPWHCENIYSIYDALFSQYTHNSKQYMNSLEYINNWNRNHLKSINKSKTILNESQAPADRFVQTDIWLRLMSNLSKNKKICNSQKGNVAKTHTHTHINKWDRHIKRVLKIVYF